MSAQFKFRDKESWKIYPMSDFELGKAPESLIKAFPRLKEVCFDPHALNPDICLVEYFGKLGLYSRAHPRVLPVCTDLNAFLALSKVPQKILLAEPLFKALKNDRDKGIIDITGGFLQDSMRLVGAGYKVRAYEQNPFLQLLILSELKKLSFGERFKFHAKKFTFDDFMNAENCVFVYDPFFRKKKEKSNPKKGFQILRQFDENDSFIDFPSDNISGKLIVKRPIGAQALWENFHSQIKGKTVRYDVYFLKN